jgi:TRAP-type mannitol/chloroaromatic compound transport system substrate-binding protein
MLAQHSNAIEKLHNEGAFKLSRSAFLAKMLIPNPDLVALWQKQAWDRLPNELRLIYYKECENESHFIAENLIARVKLNDALLMYQTNLRTRHFKLWKSLTAEGHRLRMFQRKKVCRCGANPVVICVCICVNTSLH